MPRPFRLAVALAAALALTCLTAPQPATAGSYSVRQCDYASGNGHHDFVWQAAGAPTVDQHAGSGCGEFGLAVRNGGGGTQRTYPSGAYGGWFAHAPNGTAFTHYAGAFGVLEGCCVNGMASYAEATETHDGQGGRAYLFQGHLGNASWYQPSGVQGPVGRSWSSTTSGFEARRVGFHLRCGPGFSCSQSVYGDLRLRGRSFDFTLNDFAAPGIGEPGGSLLGGGWRRGVQGLSFPASDTGGGLAGIEAAFDSGMLLASPSSCTAVAGRYARLQPCPLGRSGDWALDTARLPDGRRLVELRATDVGATTARRSYAVHVDNTAPATPRDVAVAAGDGWRAANAFELSWANPDGQHAPIARALWRACRAAPGPFATAIGGTGECVDGARAAASIAASGPIALPGAGEWDVQVWLQDAAGNVDPGTASQGRRLRYDPDPPALRFLPGEPGALERFAVEASDLSGIVAGAVELRRYGSEHWIELPTERAGDRLAATLDMRQRAGGAYDLRVRAVDAAGNVGVGYGGVRTIPDPPRPAPVERAPLPRARITMAARAAVVRRARARRPGARGTPARRWGGSRRRLAIRGGRPLLFHGRVGRPLPRHGKLVEVQAHFRDRWRTISAVRARRPGGSWRFRYVFRATGRRATYRLRARVPVEAGYPFAVGVSRPVRVTVLPR